MAAREVRTDGATLIVGEQGAGEPALVFLHYWGGSARTWDSVTGRLPGSVRSVAVNARGWGGSAASDGRFGLHAMADDVGAVAAALGLRRYVAVGHSMGGKVAQILAGRRAPGLAGLVLVAPAPPTPMAVPAEVRAGMLESYRSREGVLQALGVLAGPGLGEAGREQVIADTLRGADGAKRAWTDEGMVTDISAAPTGVTLPVEVVLGALDQVEREDVLRPALSRVLPQAAFTVVPGAGHLLPLEAPDVVAAACMRMVGRVWECSGTA